MYDEFYLDPECHLLPDGFPCGGWQTKDLNCMLSSFRVLTDLRVVRKKYSSASEPDVFEFSDKLSDLFGLYNDELYLTLEIRNGFAIQATQKETGSDELGVDLGWEVFPLLKP